MGAVAAPSAVVGTGSQRGRAPKGHTWARAPSHGRPEEAGGARCQPGPRSPGPAPPSPHRRWEREALCPVPEGLRLDDESIIQSREI